MTQNQKNTIQSIQLETTSRCSLACVTCLKANYKDTWRERDMSQDLFGHILSQLRDVKPSVHLQGWGEPLCHPLTLSYVKQLKARGFTVSFTTNGTGMSSSIADSLITSQLDGLTFSMAGIRSSSQDPLRGAGTSDAVKSAIQTVDASKKTLRSASPVLAVSYLLTPKTVPELPAAVSWCRRNGIEAFVTVHLTQAGGQKQQELQYLQSGREVRRDRFLRMAAHVRALFGKMRMEFKPFHATLSPVCDKNPLNSLFINAQGDVSPCVFLCPPVEGGIEWRNKGGSVHREPLVFGNIGKTDLAVIWEGPEYRDFRGKFRERIDFHDRRLAEVSYSLSGCRELENAVEAIGSFFSSHLPPEPCLGCAKLDGF